MIEIIGKKGLFLLSGLICQSKKNAGIILWQKVVYKWYNKNTCCSYHKKIWEGF